MFRSIEGLRGWLAWWVVCGHALNFTGLRTGLDTLDWLIRRGDIAVQLFMVVSGFVIAHMMLGRRERYAPYLVRRWFRLMPLFAAMLLVALLTRDLQYAAMLNGPPGVPTDHRIAVHAAEGRYWPWLVLLQSTMLHGIPPAEILPYAATAFLAPGWSISLEWQFYLVAPMVFAALGGRGHQHGRGRGWMAGLAIGALVVLAALALHGVLGAWRVRSFLPLGIAFFAIGIASRLLLEPGRLPWRAIGWTLALVAVELSARRVAALRDGAIVAAIWLPFLWLAAGEAGRIGHGRAMRALLRLAADNRVMRALGRWSYATYLVHFPLLPIAVAAVGTTIGHGGDAMALAIALVAAATLLASIAAHRWIERPGIALGRRMADRMNARPGNATWSGC